MGRLEVTLNSREIAVLIRLIRFQGKVIRKEQCVFSGIGNKIQKRLRSRQ